MSEIISTVFELSINVFQGFIFVYFCHGFLGSRFKPPEGKKHTNLEMVLYVTASLLMALLITMINLYYEVFNTVETYFLIGFLMLYSLFFLRGKIVMRLFIPIFIVCANYAISSMMIFIMSSVTGESSHDLMLFQHSFYRYLLVLLVNAVFVLLIVLVLRLKNRKFDMLKWTDWVAFIVIPVIALAIVLMAYAVSLEPNITREHVAFLAFISGGVVVIAVLIWVMLVKISKDREMELRYSLLEQQYQYQKENILQSGQSLKEMSTLRHDMKNKLLLIGQLITNGETDKAIKMCGACREEIEAAKLLVNSENFLLNAILNSKLAGAKEKHIQTEIVITTTQFDDIEDIDLCSILGNLLDNAIEAVQKEPKEHRIIKILMEQTGGYRSIRIQNTIGASVLKQNPQLHTTKKNKQIHGLGLLSVRHTVEKYGGEFHCYEEDGFFCCVVVLDAPQENKQDKKKAPFYAGAK